MRRLQVNKPRHVLSLRAVECGLEKQQQAFHTAMHNKSRGFQSGLEAGTLRSVPPDGAVPVMIWNRREHEGAERRKWR